MCQDMLVMATICWEFAGGVDGGGVSHARGSHVGPMPIFAAQMLVLAAFHDGMDGKGMKS